MDFKKCIKHISYKALDTTVIAGIFGAIALLLSTCIQNNYDDKKSTRLQKRYDIRLKAEQKSNALKSLRGFIKDIETLRINASMLHSALNRYTSHMDNQTLKKNVLDRKKSYDESYVYWFSVSQKNALFIREAQLMTYPTLYEHAIKQQLTFFLKQYDSYLTGYFDDLTIDKKINPNRDNQIKSYLHNAQISLGLNQAISEKITRCTNEIFNATHDWIAKGKTCKSEEWNKEKIQQMYNAINSNEKCGFNPNPAQLPSTLFPYTKDDGTKVDFCIK